MFAVIGLSATGQLGKAWNSLAAASSAPTAPPQAPAAPASPPAATTARRSASVQDRRWLLAIGQPLPGAGRSPRLQAFGYASGLVIRSYSPMPVQVTVSNGYGSKFSSFATLQNGHSVSQSLLTGKRYGYCFTQASGRGFQGARGCGTASWSEHVNGVEMPNGTPLTTSVDFKTW
jgi:hypothetical protein